MPKCQECMSSFTGFGAVCPNCRKASASGPKACVICGEFFKDVGTTCFECKAKAADRQSFSGVVGAGQQKNRESLVSAPALPSKSASASSMNTLGTFNSKSLPDVKFNPAGSTFAINRRTVPPKKGKGMTDGWPADPGERPMSTAKTAPVDTTPPPASPGPSPSPRRALEAEKQTGKTSPRPAANKGKAEQASNPRGPSPTPSPKASPRGPANAQAKAAGSPRGTMQSSGAPQPSHKGISRQNSDGPPAKAKAAGSPRGTMQSSGAPQPSHKGISRQNSEGPPPKAKAAARAASPRNTVHGGVPLASQKGGAGVRRQNSEGPPAKAKAAASPRGTMQSSGVPPKAKAAASPRGTMQSSGVPQPASPRAAGAVRRQNSEGPQAKAVPTAKSGAAAFKKSVSFGGESPSAAAGSPRGNERSAPTQAAVQAKSGTNSKGSADKAKPKFNAGAAPGTKQGSGVGKASGPQPSPRGANQGMTKKKSDINQEPPAPKAKAEAAPTSRVTVRQWEKPPKEPGLDTSQFIIDNPGKVRDIYDLDTTVMGEGFFGFVCKATHKILKKSVACKSIAKLETEKQKTMLEREIKIMKSLDHANIVKLFESFEDSTHVYLIMDLATGGELFDMIDDLGVLTEPEAATIMQQMTRALHYMHGRGVVHRDLKPENYLFLNRDPIEKNLLKLIDFGLARTFTPGQAINTKLGTPFYVDPNVLWGKYDEKCDLWSAGCILYCMLCGYPPFTGDTDDEIMDKVKAAEFSFNPDHWYDVSPEPQDLVRNLLKIRSADRMSAEQVLNCEWVKETAPRSAGAKLPSGVLDRLRRFKSSNRLKKAALFFIARTLEDDQIKNMREMFTSLDEAGDGVLCVGDVKKALFNAGVKEPPRDLQQLLEAADADGSGQVDYTEFLAATLDKKKLPWKDVCRMAFEFFDKDGDGHINLEELRQTLTNSEVPGFKKDKHADDLINLMKDVDKNNDSSIDFQEFMAMMDDSNSRTKR